MNPIAAGAAALSAKYLRIVLDREAYGIAVLNVREIIRQLKIVAIPHLPGFVKGVINAQGRVIPVIDLRMKFGLPAGLTERTCIVVVHVTPADRMCIQVGLIVDATEGVVSFADHDLQPASDPGIPVDTGYMLGLVRIKDQMKILVDLDRVLALPPPGLAPLRSCRLLSWPVPCP